VIPPGGSQKAANVRQDDRRWLSLSGTASMDPSAASGKDGYSRHDRTSQRGIIPCISGSLDSHA
jgi:hypothetical protein